MKIDNRRISLNDKTVPELRAMLKGFKGGEARGVSDELNITILENLIHKRCLNKEA
jgi:hypothetical protein